MKKHTMFSIVLLFALILIKGAAFAEDRSYSLGYEIAKDFSGLKLRISSNAIAPGLWLGITFYTPNATETETQVYPIKSGKSLTEIPVNPKFINGTFEAAVWTKKLSKDECLKTDDLCQKNGYRLTGMTAYIWRYIVNP
ncbi:MAG: hypothetical protein HZB80_00615 [Deltaproteobacteria bacterium]|nr:hypothetical protein [Deltaproteobacteria bacterium]